MVGVISCKITKIIRKNDKLKIKPKNNKHDKQTEMSEVSTSTKKRVQLPSPESFVFS